MIEIAKIQTAVAEAFGLHFDDLKQSSRVRATAFPRQIAIYLAKQLTDASLPEIGRQFGKHQTTVMHSIAKIHHLRATDAGVDKAIQNLLEKLTS